MKTIAIQCVVAGALAGLTALTACRKNYNFEDGYNKAPVIDTAGVSALDTNMARIDSSGFADARRFPGLVSVLEPRLQHYEVEVDLNYKVMSPSLRISAPPGNWISTGLYAAPGELVRVVVPPDSEGLAVQIGAHTDNVSNKTPLIRPGVIFTRKILLPGVNYVRNIYGGTVYLIPSAPTPKKIKVLFSNVVKSPDFVLGKTTDAEWKAMLRASNVPVFEMRSERFIITMYRKVMLGMLERFNAQQVMEEWDEAIELDYNGWYGLEDDPADPRDQAPATPHRFVLDVQISLGSGHSGYPCMAYMDWHSDFIDVDLITTGASWGPFHEIGHNFQMGSMWSWGGADDLGEVSNNLFVFKIADRHGRKPPRIYTGDFVAVALAHAKTTGAKRFSSVTNVFGRLVPFVQLFQRYGYGMMTALSKAARRENRVPIIDEVRKNFFFVQASLYAKVNLKPFFDQWGIEVSPSAVEQVRHLPLLTEKVWEKDIRL
ncbi:M60 family metallopeptidase [Chitinophaga lutea]